MHSDLTKLGDSVNTVESTQARQAVQETSTSSGQMPALSVSDNQVNLAGGTEPGELTPEFQSSPTDVQQQYKVLKDSLQKVRLPPGYKTKMSLRGVEAQNSKTAKVIYSCAEYSETLLKLLLTLKAIEPLTENKLDSLLISVPAQIHFLQAEKDNCFVNGKFGDNVGSLFREFKDHVFSFSSEDIATLDCVVQLSNARSSQQCGNHHGSGQRRGEGYSGPRGHGFGASNRWSYNAPPVGYCQCDTSQQLSDNLS